MNQHKNLTFFKIGFLLTLLTGNALADECGLAKWVEAGSAGVKIVKNTCKEPLRLSSGAVFELAPNGRVWIKLDPNGDENMQLICQNQSSKAVNVNLTSATAPWIKLDGVKNCEEWNNDKLRCDGAKGEKSSFFCAVADATSRFVATPKMATSVRFREIPKPISIEELISDITPVIELCKNVYDISEKVTVSWTISEMIMKNLSVESDNKNFITCVEAVTKNINIHQDFIIQHSF